MSPLRSFIESAMANGPPSLVRPAQLRVVPADHGGRDEAQADALRRLLLDRVADLRRQLAAAVAREQRHAVLRHLARVALHVDVALEHDAAQLVVLDAVLDLERRARVALEVPRLLRLRVGPTAQLRPLVDVPEGHQVRAAVRAERGAAHDHLLVEERLQLLLAHADLVASRRHGRRSLRSSGLRGGLRWYTREAVPQGGGTAKFRRGAGCRLSFRRPGSQLPRRSLDVTAYRGGALAPAGRRSGRRLLAAALRFPPAPAHRSAAPARPCPSPRDP